MFSSYSLYFVLHRQRSLALQQRDRKQQQHLQAQQQQPQVFQQPTIPQQHPQVFQKPIIPLQQQQVLQQPPIPQRQPQQLHRYTPEVQDTAQVMEPTETSCVSGDIQVSQDPLCSTSRDSSLINSSGLATVIPFSMEMNPEDVNLSLSEINTPNLSWKGMHHISSSSSISRL